MSEEALVFDFPVLLCGVIILTKLLNFKRYLVWQYFP